MIHSLVSYTTVSLRDEIVFEQFPEGWLVFFADQLRILTINPLAFQILQMSVCGKSVDIIVDELSLEYDSESVDLKADVIRTIEFFLFEEIVYLKYPIADRHSDSRFVRNSKIETSLGNGHIGLFFKSEKSQFLLNTSGYLLWERLHIPRRVSELVSYVMSNGPNCKPDVVCRDVETFLDFLLKKELILEVGDISE